MALANGACASEDGAVKCPCGRRVGSHAWGPLCATPAPNKPAPRPKKRKPSRRFYEAANVIEQFTQGEEVFVPTIGHGAVLNPLNSLPDIVVVFPVSGVKLLLKRDVRKMK